MPALKLTYFDFDGGRGEPARLALFPSVFWHGTRPFDDGERLTVAFDVVPR